MSNRVRINITTTPGRIFFWFSNYRIEIFLFASLIIFFACKSSAALNNKISDATIHYLVKPSATLVKLPLNITTSIGNFASNSINLHHDNIILKQQNTELRNMVLHYKNFFEEAKQLQNLLDFKENNNYSTIASHIFINNTGAYQHSSLINIGTDNSVQKNQIVISENGLVGRVIKANKRSSHILLLSDPKSKIPAYSSDSRERMIVSGQHNELPKIEYLAKNNTLKVGEIIYTSGDGMVFPSNIPIGITIKDRGGEFAVKPFVDIAKLEFVLIVNMTNES